MSIRCNCIERWSSNLRQSKLTIKNHQSLWLSKRYTTYCNGDELANKKYVIFIIYRPPKQNINYFLNSVSEGLDFYSKHHENNCILGDFNATPSKPRLTLFLENQNLKVWSKSDMFQIFEWLSYWFDSHKLQLSV